MTGSGSCPLGVEHTAGVLLVDALGKFLLPDENVAGSVDSNGNFIFTVMEGGICGSAGTTTSPAASAATTASGTFTGEVSGTFTLTKGVVPTSAYEGFWHLYYTPTQVGDQCGNQLAPLNTEQHGGLLYIQGDGAILFAAGSVNGWGMTGSVDANGHVAMTFAGDGGTCGPGSASLDATSFIAATGTLAVDGELANVRLARQ